MKAVIMAGGEGTRLRPLTANQPKPMLPMANRPMAEHIVELLRRHGFEEIVVTVAFMANAVSTYFGDGSEFGVRMVYATEEMPLGTAGSILNARDELDGRFLVISGDVLTDIDLTSLVDCHIAKGATATLALKSVENPLEFGIVITDEHGQIERFLEKPTWGQVFSDTINTGIYVLEPEVLDFIARGRPVDFSEEVFPSLLGSGRPLHGWVTDGYWEDVGTIEAYLRAHQDILEGKVEVNISGFPLRPDVHVGEGTEVDPTATIDGPAIIGANCRIGASVHLAPYCVIGANVVVGEGSNLERTVVHDNCYLGARVVSRGSVIARSGDLRQGVHLEEGVVLGEGSMVGHQAVISANVRVYPHKTVEPRAIVNSSIIWESRGARRLFGKLGVSGLPNVDLSPELVVRVAMAYGSTLPKGSTVTMSRDSSRAARVLKRAAMVGLNSAGCNVDDLEVATVPVTRFHARNGSSAAGITVRLVPGDPQSVVMRFLDADGMDIDESAERKVERLFYREESRRVLAAEIGDIDFPSRILELYTLELVSGVDLERIRRAAFRLVLDYSYGTASYVMPTVLSKLGAEVLAVNPHVSTVGVMNLDTDRQAAWISELVRSAGAHLGAIIGPDGETVTVVDDRGRVLSDDETLLALVRLVTDSIVGARIAVPVSATREVDRLCRQAGGRIEWMKLGSGTTSGPVSEGQVDFAGNTAGAYAFPEFLPAFDAVASLVHLLDLLARSGAKLSGVTNDLPTVHVAHRELATLPAEKGLIMRLVIEQAKGDQVVTIDGVKTIDEQGWTLVVPDVELPVTHVFAESDSPASSEARAAEACDSIQTMLDRAVLMPQ